MRPPIKSEDLRQTFADVFEVPLDQINAESSPDTIESWDSIRHLHLVMSLEQDFGVQFDPDEVVQLMSVSLTAELLNQKISRNGDGR